MILFKCLFLLAYTTLAFANYECGTLPSTFPKSVKGNRISGGSVATPNSIPYQARMVFKKAGNKIKLCGGSLVELKPGNGSQWVLTAAHCAYYAELRRNFFPDEVQVILGAHRPNEEERTQLKVDTKRIISHPRYDDVEVIYDITLVLLKEYVIYNNEIRSVCLPKPDEPVPLDGPCFASGWGITYEGGRGSDVLRIAEMKPLPKDECRIKPENHAIIFCAYGVDRSATCQGDSGGPVVCLKNNKATLYGIVSYGPLMCGDARHSVKFVKVPAMMQWVQDTARRIDSTVPVVSRFEPKPSEQKVDQKGTQPSPSVTPGRVDVGQKDILKDLPEIPTRENVKDTPGDYKGSDVFNFIYRDSFPSASKFPDLDQIISDFMSPGAGGMNGGSFFNSPRKRKRLTVYLLYQEVEVMSVDLVSMIHHSPFSLAFANYECGTLPSTFPKSVKGNRISGGSVATPNSIPYQARLFLEKDGNKVKLCGGTLVELKPGNGSQWVLTAAHCTYYAERNFFPDKVEVILGAHRPNENEKTQLKVGAKRIISHPRYDDVATVYDLSLVLLKEYVIYNNEIRSACLPKANEPVPLDVPCFASGWGLTYHGGRGSEVLKIAEMKILEKDECRIKPEEHAIIFCAYGVDRSATCQGDSGGPLVCLINNKATLYGIVSFGPPMCGDARHSVKFAKVPAMLEWVQDTARSIDSTVPVVSRFEPKPSEQKVDQKGTQPSPNVGQKDIMKDLPKIPTRDNVKDTPNNYKGSDVFNFIYRDTFPSESRFPDLEHMMSNFMNSGSGGMNGGSFFNSPRVFIETKTINHRPSLSRSRSDVESVSTDKQYCNAWPSRTILNVPGNEKSTTVEPVRLLGSGDEIFPASTIKDKCG
ncbi:Chymotrypsin-like elastase family member 1 [Trichinella nelsoni]|uniref:Chymotrypsin-like elastase family member 1 n=1 Tax=Trichinella nelsoni TaxID=6336 RepID=A0A0V0SKG1_9BILA|nr:Chymotrypsin-like elastase family member 1 [Trichinella nelsoni]